MSNVFSGSKGSKFPFMVNELRAGIPGALVKMDGGDWSLLKPGEKSFLLIESGDDAPDAGFSLGDLHYSRPLMDADVEALIASGISFL